MLFVPLLLVHQGVCLSHKFIERKGFLGVIRCYAYAQFRGVRSIFFAFCFLSPVPQLNFQTRKSKLRPNWMDLKSQIAISSFKFPEIKNLKRSEKRNVCSAIHSTGNQARKLTSKSKEMLTSQIWGKGFKKRSSFVDN